MLLHSRSNTRRMKDMGLKGVNKHTYLYVHGAFSVCVQLMIIPETIFLITSNNTQRTRSVRPNVSNYPKHDPFQAISLARGLRQIVSAKKFGSI